MHEDAHQDSDQDADHRAVHDERSHGTEAHGPLRIVLGIDFSQPARRGIEWAAALAEARHASVLAVHAIEPTPLSSMGEAAESLVARCVERLERECTLLASRGIPFEAHAAVGRPWQVIRDAVAERGADLVIVGNRGLSPIKRALIGSNADRVLRAVDVPVLVVHASDIPRGHLRVLVATDFSVHARETVAAFRSIFVPSSIRLEVRVVHATVPPAVIEAAEAPLIERVDWTALDDDARLAAERVADIFRADGIEAGVGVQRGGAARTVLAEVRGWRADILLVGRRGMSGFERMVMGSTAERVLHAAGCAVFTAQHVPVAAPAVRAAFIS